tara:strand:+ start:4765 stop:4908 length:144 start_codon:yes stop_codon:yes gene_type:complete
MKKSKKKVKIKHKFMKWLMECPYEWSLIDATDNYTELFISNKKRKVK